MSLVFYLDTFVWLAAFIVFGIIELTSFNLVTVWFSAAALVNILLTLCFQSFTFLYQTILFFILSFLCVALFYPHLKRHFGRKVIPTNVNSLIGEAATVCQTIKPDATGQIKVNGSVWTAVSQNHQLIAKGTPVTVCEINGVKAVVSPIQSKPNQTPTIKEQ